MRMLVAGEWTEGARQEDVRSPFSGEAIDVPRVKAAALNEPETTTRLERRDVFTTSGREIVEGNH